MNERRLEQTTWILWLVFVVVILLMTAHAHSTPTQPHHTVTFNYWLGANNWWQGNDLYNHTGTGFIYFPQSAILYSPLTLLPFVVSEVVLRLILLVVLALSIFVFSSMFHQKATHFFFASLFTMIIGFSAAKYGQFNIVIAECMLLGLWLMAKEQFWLATIVFCVGLALKPLMLPLMGIVFILVPQMRIKLLLGFIILLLFPFLTQHPHYVVRQYLEVPMMLKAVVHDGNNQLDDHWSQFYILLKQFDVPVSHVIQNTLLLLGGLVALSLCAVVYFRKNKRAMALYFYLLAALFLMIFNPRNEGNSFVILAPAIGFYLTQAIDKKRYLQIVLTVLVFLGIMLSTPIIHLFNNPHRWFSPLMAIVFFFSILPSVIYTKSEISA